MTPELDIYGAFHHHLRRRDAELQATMDLVSSLMSSGSAEIRKRVKNPNLNTTSVAVREAALKKNILVKMDELTKLAGRLTELMVGLHMDETELALVLEARNQSAIDYWKRLADGNVYAGARTMLDSLHQRHGIDATMLATLTQTEIMRVGHLIHQLTSERSVSALTSDNAIDDA